jgi:hypothetical protein
MIKNWKLFLESNSRDQEILDNIRDILISLKVDHSIRVSIQNKSIPFEFGKVRVTFIVEGEIGLDEVQTISHLDSYLRSEEFDPCNSEWAKSNKINELDVVVQRKSGKLTQYAISKLIAMLNGINKDVIDLTRIEFEYYLPDYLRYYNDEKGNIFKIGELIKL